MKGLLFDLLTLFLWLPPSAQVFVCGLLASFLAWVIAKALFWVWNKNDDRGIGHAGRMGRLAKESGFEYFETPPRSVVEPLEALPLFRVGEEHVVEHLLRRRQGDLDTYLFFLTRQQETRGFTGEFFTTVGAYRIAGADFPDFVMMPGTTMFDPDEVVVDEGLAKVYTIKTLERHGVLRFFTPGVISFFEKEQKWCVGLGGEWIAFWKPMQSFVAEPIHGVSHEVYDPIVAKMPIRDIEPMLADTRAILEVIAAAAGRSVQTAEQAKVRRRSRART